MDMRHVVLVFLAVMVQWFASAGFILASPVTVVHATFAQRGNVWEVSVTLRHADTGWEHYANLWVVETLEGKELGRRILLHPHENEQPFERSETITIPTGITRVRIRAGDNKEGLNSESLVVDLSKTSGNKFKVRR